MYFSRRSILETLLAPLIVRAIPASPNPPGQYIDYFQFQPSAQWQAAMAENSFELAVRRLGEIGAARVDAIMRDAVDKTAKEAF